jgi:predicted heme/steroid binding protein
MREIKSEELLSSYGKDGNPVYIAFEGKVYDVSKSPLRKRSHNGGQMTFPTEKS